MPNAENGTAYHKVAFDGGGFFCLYCAWSGTFAAEAFAHEGSDIPPVDMCHNGHPFAPGVSTDHAPGESDPRWCNTCGEVRVLPPGEQVEVEQGG